MKPARGRRLASWAPGTRFVSRTLFAVLGLLLLASSASAQTSPATRTLVTQTAAIGGETTTPGGCLAGAGYVYCPSLDTCVRLWESPCPGLSSNGTGSTLTCAEELDKLVREGSCASLSPNGTVESPGMPGAFCPQCAVNGDYLPEQCWGSTG